MVAPTSPVCAAGVVMASDPVMVQVKKLVAADPLAVSVTVTRTVA